MILNMLLFLMLRPVKDVFDSVDVHSEDSAPGCLRLFSQSKYRHVRLTVTLHGVQFVPHLSLWLLEEAASLPGVKVSRYSPVPEEWARLHLESEYVH